MHRHENVGATVSVRVNQAAHTWLSDHYARLEREIEILEERQARLEEWEEELAEEPGGGRPAIDTVASEDHFLAVATSPAAGTHIRPGESGYFGIGWHTDSQHDAGLTAEDECRRQGGRNACFSNASGKSMRGGCVGLAMATWRDRGEDAERTYVVTSSTFPDVIARNLRSGCERDAFGGKNEGTVVEHACEIERIVCAREPG